MLQNIRDNAQGFLAWIIVILIIIPFALWGIHEYFGPSQREAVAEINGQEISGTEFQQSLYQERQRLAQQRHRINDQRRQLIEKSKKDPNSASTLQYLELWEQQLKKSEKNLEQTTLDRMIEEEILVQTALNNGFWIGDSFLASYIRESFSENGQFSQETYQEALRRQGVTVAAFEKQVRRFLLTEQIRKGVNESTVFTDYDRRQYERLQEQQRLVSYLTLPLAHFKSTVKVTDEQIQSYYKENIKDYQIPEKVSISYVELSREQLATKQTITGDDLKQYYEERKASYITPAKWHVQHILFEVAKNSTEAETKAVEQKAKDVLAKIQAKQLTFKQAVEQFSDDQDTKAKNGDLGWLEATQTALGDYGDMLAILQKGVQSLKNGEFSGLIKTSYGYNIAKLVEFSPEKIKSLDQVKDELRNSLQKELAENQFYDQREKLISLAYENSGTLEPIVKELGLQITHSKLFSAQERNLEGVLSNPAVISAAFSETVKEQQLNSDVIDLGEQSAMVLRLKNYEPMKPQPLTEVKEAIKTLLVTKEAHDKARKLANSLLEQLTQGKSADELAQANQLKWSEAHWVKRYDAAPVDPTVTQAMFKIGKPAKGKAVYQIVKLHNDDYVLAAVLDTKESKAEKKDNDDKEILTQLNRMNQQMVGESEYKQFLSNLKLRAEVKISKKTSDAEVQ